MANNFSSNFSNGYTLNGINFPNNTQSQQINQQFLPTPQGSLYMINNPSELSNVPVGFGLSVAISFSENLLYLKTIQNGVPVVVGYKISSLENIPTAGTLSLNKEEQQILSRIDKIEKTLEGLNKNGEKLQWQV